MPYAVRVAHPSGFSTRFVDAGNRVSFSSGRLGRASSSPPQFGQRPPSFVSVQSRQNVHSKLQIMASPASGGRSLSQHSQLGRSSSMVVLPVWLAPADRITHPGGALALSICH
jgi:hypothetical protein